MKKLGEIFKNMHSVLLSNIHPKRVEKVRIKYSPAII